MTHFAYSVPSLERHAVRRLSLAWPVAGLGVAVVEMAAITGLAWATGAAHQALTIEDAAPVAPVLGLFVALAFALVSFSRGHYSLEKFLSEALVDRVLVAWLSAWLFGVVALFLMDRAYEVSRTGIIAFGVVGLLGVTGLRFALRRLVLAGLDQGWIAARRVMLIGSAAEIDAVSQRLDRSRHGLAVVGTVSDDNAAAARARAVDVARALRPDGIVLLLPWSDGKRIERWVDALIAVPTAIHLAPPRYLDRFRGLPLGWHSALSDLVLVRPPLRRSEQLAKRLFDLAVAGAALVLLGPLFFVVGLLIRLDSPGPALFRQARNGFNHDVFYIYKFRTMRPDAEANGFQQARPGDARVTRFGRFLRRWNIDELPQILNVIRGEMSIVGPRPHPLALDGDYAKRLAHYACRHNMKPGITGWAQVNGHRGPTETEDKMRDRLVHDLHYIDNWSLWLDIKIMLLTVLSPRAFKNAC